ncbi:glycosyltransferase family 1 protein [Pedobacter sp. SYP-B3415]|uniref:glycosyltransferase family 4 protein n=1 Tax=Pedobacter sp. SYP-B3415 TaxID=2496641 RepID=UPI00101C2D37|nr:glycosyltransferase family 1 protein [Pedobacter sp. SYP-B3415]
MASRKQVNILFRHNDNWIGGTYYILNMIRALKLLADERRPHLNVLYSKGSPLDLIREIDYPYVTYITLDLQLSFFKKVVNKLSKRITGRTPFKFTLPLAVAENVYPLKPNISDEKIKNAYYWIPDFQEHYYPEFFSALERKLRKQDHLQLVRSNSSIVFSSQNALDDFDRFFPGNKNVKKILRFSSFIGTSYLELDPDALFSKFGIEKPYFIVCNQFWKHKNHWVVLKALQLLKSTTVNYQVVFTGKEYDHRNPDYVDGLKAFITENGLSHFVKFLGFIDRDEQLLLMKQSVAIIQPSLFEGWSTVIEDAKALGAKTIVSNIPLHREQIVQNCRFFDPENASELAEKIKDTLGDQAPAQSTNYSTDQERFANDFIHLFD